MNQTKHRSALSALLILLIFHAYSCNQEDKSPATTAIPPPQDAPRPVSSVELITVSEKYTVDQLMNCIGSSDPHVNCKLDSIEMDAPEFTVDELLARTLVESAWMGARFKELLESIPAPFLKLAGCSSGTIIAKDMNTSLLRNGAIGFYAGGLAISDDEIKETQVKSATSVDSNLPTFGLLASLYPAEENSRSKELFDGPSNRRLRNASVLIHEWAHACDFQNLKRGQPILSMQMLPVESTNLKKFASFVYFGHSELAADIETMDPLSVAQEFANDRAPTLYAYSNAIENFAEVISAHYLRSVYGIASVHAMVDLKSGQVLWSQRDHDCGAKVTETTRKALELLGRGMASRVDLVKTCEPVEDAKGITWKEQVEKFSKQPS